MFIKKFPVMIVFGMMLALLLASCGRATPAPEPTAAPEAVAEPTAAPETEPTPEEAEAAAEEAAADAEDTEAAASDSDAAETDAAGSETSSSGESAPAQTRVVTIGVNAQFEPFVFLDQNGTLAGFDIDIMNALNAELDFEVAYVNTSFDELFTGLESGDIDAAISAISVTDARRERVDFTEPYFASGLSPVSYFSAGQALATRTDNTTITGVDSLTDATKLGVKHGTTGADYAAANTAAEVVEYDESTPLLQALVNGDVDAVILDTPVIIRFIKSNPGASIKLTGGPITEEVYAIAVGKERPLVLEGLNEGLRMIQEDGVYDAIYTKWFGTP